jgi:hypothetical protein
MKNIYKSFLFLALCTLVISACGIFPKKDRAADNRTLAESKFNPLGDIGDDDIITANVPLAGESDTSGAILPPPRTGGAGAHEEQVFSVQLFASKSSSEAKEYMISISSSFEEDVRIDYQAPYYRVCVGRAESFEQGDELLRKVNAMGFPRAWLVRIRK